MTLRVLIVHNVYQQRGGEDSVVEAESALLRSRGHAVREFIAHNDVVKQMGKLRLAGRSLWSIDAAREFEGIVAEFSPDVVHVHNTFPLISPSLYWRASKLKIPVVQTLHNFRLMCPQAMFLREGKVCEQCLGKLAWRGIVHACYRGSHLQSAVSAGTMSLHRALGTWRNKIDVYIALSEFCRDKFIEAGVPQDRIALKPNFVDIAVPEPARREGFLFVGRLSEEKGVATLAAACRRLGSAQLAVAGVGPQQGDFDGVPGVHLLGLLPGEQIAQRMRMASTLIIPSIWYENFPRTLVEAYANGLPVIASRIGALAELVEEGVTGLLFEPGDPEALAATMAWAQQNPEAMAEMGRNARLRFEQRYGPQENYRQLIGIYERARDTRAAR